MRHHRPGGAPRKNPIPPCAWVTERLDATCSPTLHTHWAARDPYSPIDVSTPERSTPSVFQSQPHNPKPAAPASVVNWPDWLRSSFEYSMLTWVGLRFISHRIASTGHSRLHFDLPGTKFVPDVHCDHHKNLFAHRVKQCATQYCTVANGPLRHHGVNRADAATDRWMINGKQRARALPHYHLPGISLIAGGEEREGRRAALDLNKGL
jgi:hypothetical protein